MKLTDEIGKNRIPNDGRENFMTGLLEEFLTSKYGCPAITRFDCGVEFHWQSTGNDSILYKGLTWDDTLRLHLSVLESIYGDSRGGSLLGGSLKVAIVYGQVPFGLYQIEELQRQPEVIRASPHDPTVCYFMDSANVWFYGTKDGQLFVFDAEADELDSLGSIDIALNTVFDEWASAAP